MKLIVFLLIMVSCSTKSKLLDYMITLQDGTYICEEYLRGGDLTDTYGSCQHVLLGLEKDEITIQKSHRVIPISDRFK